MHDTTQSVILPAIPAESEPLLRLLLSGAPAASLRRLLDAHGDAVAVLAAGSAQWAAQGLDAVTCAAIARPDRRTLAASLRWLEADSHALIGWSDPAYPPQLREIASPPAALFVVGDASLLWRPAIAVVGSRAATAGGRANAARFATVLAEAGLAVTSGLAAGVDACAHGAALEVGGITTAVLGTGPDVAYPRSNRALMAAVAEAGVLVSEHAPGTPALRTHFPSRNRIIAGLSLATLVVEAAQRSGALITARLAADAGREVFAIPGSIHNPLARGCHRLIRDGAALVETPEEILDSLAAQVAMLAGSQSRRLQAGADAGPALDGLLSHPDYNILWQAIGHDPICMDELVLRTGLTAARASSMLLALELEGHVVAEHGRYSRRVARARSARS